MSGKQLPSGSGVVSAPQPDDGVLALGADDEAGTGARDGACAGGPPQASVSSGAPRARARIIIISFNRYTKCTTARASGEARAAWSQRLVSRVLYRASVALRAASIIPLGRPLPDASCSLPGGSGGPPSRAFRRIASLRGLAPGVVYRAAPVTGRAVGSYPTFSPLPPGAFARGGGLFSVALSSGLLPPGVTRHPALRSSDFPPVS